MIRLNSTLNNIHNNKASNYDKLVVKLLPKEYQEPKENLYDRIMQICSYVASLSDSYAMTLYKKITGEVI